MFLFFVNLYRSFFLGVWQPFDNVNSYLNDIKPIVNDLGTFLTSLFNNVDTPFSTLGETFFYTPNRLPTFIATILALITSIGVVVMAVKGVKKAFGIFFGQIR